MNDLQITMICHNLIWYYLLNNNVDKYLIQYQTRQIISQIIQLTFYILKPDDFANFSCVGGRFLLNRTNQSMITTHGRVLATNTYYDTIEAKFISNLYSDDGYFPYPNQTQPLFDYSIRLSGRSQNIQLQTNIIYTFTVQSENRYICIMRNQTNHEWEYDNCHTSYINQTIRCNCSKLGPTTIVDDYNYLINGLGEQRIILSNIIPFILFCQTIVWGCLLVASIYLDRHIHKEQSMSHGIILHINRKARRFVSFNLSEIKNTTDEKGMEPNSPDKSTYPYYEHHYDTQKNVQDIHSSMDIHDHLTNIDHPHDDHSVSLKSLQDDQDIQNHAEEDQKVNIVEKYSLQNFQILHSILNIIYKYKKNQPRWFRSLLILMRWTFCITLAGLFSYLLVFYETSVYPTIGGFLASRIIETLITEQFKQTSYINAVILKLISLFLMFIIFSLSLIGFQMMYVLITDQTDWIISYIIAFIIDLVFLDLISLIANRYLGEEAKDRLKKKVKRIKKQYEAWKIMKSRIR